MTQARESFLGSMQQRLDPFVIHHLGAVDLRLEYETLGGYQQVTLTALDLLASVVTPLFLAYRGALYRLGIHDARAWLRIPAQANPQPFTDGAVDPLPSTVHTPSSEVVD